MIFSVFLVLGLIILTIYLSFPSLFDANNSDDKEDFTNFNIIEYPVHTGEIVHTYETAGEIISEMPELYIVNYNIENVTGSDFKLLKQNGENFTKGDAIYSDSGKIKNAEFNGKVVDFAVVENDNKKNISIKLLNFDALYIMTWIDQEKYKKISYDTQVKITVEGTEYDAKIKNIGFEVVGSRIPVYLVAPITALPGSSVSISFVLDVDTIGLYVPLNAVYYNGENYYAFIREDDTKKRVELKVGQEFSIGEGENEFKYIEILSGIKESDILIVEEVSDYGARLEKELNNE